MKLAYPVAHVAREAFENNAKDVERLLEIHETLGGPGPGYKSRLGVLNKSAVVLVTAIWEAFCEDLAAAAIRHIVDHAPRADVLPVELKKLVARELAPRDGQHELAVWALADDGWRAVVGRRLDELWEKRGPKINTPSAAKLDELFLKAIGLERVSDSWCWRGMSADKARAKLDEYIKLRGDIAHRGASAEGCYKAQVRDFFGHVRTLVELTGQHVNAFTRNITKKSLF